MPFDGTPDRSPEEICLAIDALILIEAYFENGKRWTQGAARDRRGRVCLLAAVTDVIPHQRLATRALVREYLARVSPLGSSSAIISPRKARFMITSMNDHFASFEGVRQAIIRARVLALSELRKAHGLVAP